MINTYTIKSLLLLNGWRSARAHGSGRRFDLGAIGENLAPYLTRDDGTRLVMPDDVRDLPIHRVDSSQPRDGNGLYPTYRASWEALGARDFPGPSATLDDVSEAIRRAYEACALIAIDCDEAVRRIEAGLEALEAAQAEIKAAVDVLAAVRGKRAAA